MATVPLLSLDTTENNFKRKNLLFQVFLLNYRIHKTKTTCKFIQKNLKYRSNEDYGSETAASSGGGSGAGLGAALSCSSRGSPRAFGLSPAAACPARAHAARPGCGTELEGPGQRRWKRYGDGERSSPGPAPPVVQQPRSRSSPRPAAPAAPLRGGGGTRPAGRPRRGHARAPPAGRPPCPCGALLPLLGRLGGERGARVRPARPAPAGVGEAAGAPPAPPTPEPAGAPRGHGRRRHRGSPGGSARPLSALPRATVPGRVHSSDMPRPTPASLPLPLLFPKPIPPGRGRPARACAARTVRGRNPRSRESTGTPCGRAPPRPPCSREICGRGEHADGR